MFCTSIHRSSGHYVVIEQPNSDDRSRTMTNIITKATSTTFAAFATFVMLTAAVPNSAEAGPSYPFERGSLSGMDLGSGR
jgi:hypothetical protein